jgi:uncharacterized membrane protein YoaK (UPF0700 family)
MSGLAQEFKETLFPGPKSRDGPLPPFLVALTFVTGLVDSFSYLVLGRVFVGNMTGNLVLLALAMAGTPGFSVQLNLVALGSFVVGSFGGGVLGRRDVADRAQILTTAAAIESLLFASTMILSTFAGSPMSVRYAYLFVAALAFSMGMQGAAARKLGIADLNTVVVTQVIVGIGAESRWVGGSGSRLGRRVTAVGSMFAGAAVGALSILRSFFVLPLIIAMVIAVLVALGSRKHQENSGMNS